MYGPDIAFYGQSRVDINPQCRNWWISAGRWRHRYCMWWYWLVIRCLCDHLGPPRHACSTLRPAESDFQTGSSYESPPNSYYLRVNVGRREVHNWRCLCAVLEVLVVHCNESLLEWSFILQQRLTIHHILDNDNVLSSRFNPTSDPRVPHPTYQTFSFLVLHPSPMYDIPVILLNVQASIA